MKQAISFFLFLIILNSGKTQVVYEHHRNDIYEYLYRMANKGLVVFDDQIRPLSRVYLADCLDSLAKRSDQLTKLEREELAFYQRDLSDKAAMAATANLSEGKAGMFVKDPWNRLRGLLVTGKDFLMRVDPILSGGGIYGSGRALRTYGSGARLYGYAGKHWAWHFSFHDVTEAGRGIDTLRENSATGIIGRITANKKSINYSELRGGISYAWKNGSIAFGQDYLLWGYGQNGRAVLSDKAPTYPYLRLDYQPFRWLKFNYTHAWLNSNVIDSNRTYNTGVDPFGGRRDIYVSKYMASHSLQFTPLKGLDIHLGESVVYSDGIKAGYLIPILFFKAYDKLISNDNINAGSNGQLFLQLSSRNHVKKTHLYATLFVDEIFVSSAFNRTKSRNQLGYTLGVNTTDVGLSYLTLGAEYTRIRPFVYRNLAPAQNYTHNDYVLGDWIGSNADRMLFFARFTPIPRLRTMLRYEYIRKGGAGTLNQQYFQQPQPPFLFDLQYKSSIWYAEATYQWIPGVYIYTNYTHQKRNDAVSGVGNVNRRFSFGFQVGL